MKTVQLQVDDNSLETLLIIVKNLKKNIVKNIIVKDCDTHLIPTVSDEENMDYENLLKKMSADDKIIVSEKSYTI
jgi:hypothetical protein